MSPASAVRRSIPFALTALALLLGAGLSTPLAEAQTAPAGTVRWKDRVWVGLDAAYSVAPDPATGEVWIGTTGGLVRVAPGAAERTLYTRLDGLPDSAVWALHLDSRDLWAATDAGIARLDRATGEVAKTWTRFPGGVGGNSTPALVRDGSDFWVGTRDAGLFRWNPATEDWRQYRTGPGNQTPVRDVLPREGEVLAATDGSGVLRVDRATDQTRFITGDDGLMTSSVFALAETPGHLWFGTDRGLWRLDERATGSERWREWNRTTGLPSNRVTDLLPRGDDLWIATHGGVAILDLPTGNFTYFSIGSGLQSNFVVKLHEAGDQVWIVTNAGVTAWSPATTKLTHYRTGNGPQFSSAVAAATDGDLVWFATLAGASAYDARAGRWSNLNERDGLDGSPVFGAVPDHDGVWDVWFPTGQGLYGWSEARQEWAVLKRREATATNVYYGLAVDGNQLWIGEWEQGLIRFNKSDFRDWAIFHRSNTCLADTTVRDVDLVGDNLWLTFLLTGLQSFNKRTAQCEGPYGKESGLPSEFVLKSVVDGKDLWVVTAAGVARFNTVTKTVTAVYNRSTGLPIDDARDVLRDGAHLWIAGIGGLARLNVATGEVRAWTLSEGLLAPAVHGVARQGNVLYLATALGVQRLDLATLRFLPMHEGPGARGGAIEVPTTLPPGALRFPPVARITSPANGEAVYGRVTLEGYASSPDHALDRVEVRIGRDGAWQAAAGTERWTFAWEATALARAEPYDVYARAVAGNHTGEASDVVKLTVVPPPMVPLDVRVSARDVAFRDRAVNVTAFVVGDEPLSATLHYRAKGHVQFTPVEMTRAGSLFRATIPARDTDTTSIAYYVEARSGLLKRTDPADVAIPHSMNVLAAPRASAELLAPASVLVRAGETVEVPLTLRNTGSNEDRFSIAALGPRAHWVTLPAGALSVPAGGDLEVVARVSAPRDAYSDATALVFHLAPERGDFEPVEARVPLTVEADRASVKATTPTPTQETPAPGALLAALAGAGAAGLGRALRARRGS